MTPIRSGYILAVTDEDRKLAKDELGEDPSQTPSHIQTLRAAVNEMKHLTAPDSDDFLLTFLRQGKFSQLRAREVLDNFVRSRVTDPYKQIYTNKPELSPVVRQVFETGALMVLPGVTETCPRIMLFRNGLIDPSVFTLVDLMTTAMISLEIALLDPFTQIHGLQTIEDYRGFGVKHAALFSVGAFRIAISAFVSSMPVRYKGFHLYEAPSLISRVVIPVFKTIVSTKIASRLHAHADDASLHAKVRGLFNIFCNFLYRIFKKGEEVIVKLRWLACWIDDANIILQFEI